MKPRLTTTLFALVGFLAASQPALAAPKQTDGRTSLFVTTLQSVSPDPLGGRLGLAASTARTAAAPVTTAPNSRGLTAQSPRATVDQRAYLIWKSSQKS